MTKRDIFIFCFKWRKLILRLCLFILTLVTIMQYLMPQSFPAKATVLVERNRSPVMRSDYAPGLDMVEVQNTEAQIILSRTVMAAAVDLIKPHERASKTNSIKEFIKSAKLFMIDIGLSEDMGKREKWIEHLLKNVKTKAVVNSNIIHILYADENPQWSSDMINAVTQAYLQHHLKIYTPNNTLLLQTQLSQVEDKLNAQRAELSNYKKHSGTSALRQNQTELVGLIGTMRERSATAKATLAELSQKYKSGHTKIKAIKAKIHQYNKTQRITLRKLQKLEITDSRIREMELDIELQQNLFRDYKQRYNEAKLNESVSTDMVNIRVVEYASPAPKPNHSRLFYIILAGIGGLIMAFGIAFIFEYFDRRINDPHTAELLLGIPELGSVPQLKR